MLRHAHTCTCMFDMQYLLIWCIWHALIIIVLPKSFVYNVIIRRYRCKSLQRKRYRERERERSSFQEWNRKLSTKSQTKPRLHEAQPLPLDGYPWKLEPCWSGKLHLSFSAIFKPNADGWSQLQLSYRAKTWYDLIPKYVSATDDEAGRAAAAVWRRLGHWGSG